MEPTSDVIPLTPVVPFVVPEVDEAIPPLPRRRFPPHVEVLEGRPPRPRFMAASANTGRAGMLGGSGVVGAQVEAIVPRVEDMRVKDVAALDQGSDMAGSWRTLC